MIRPIYIKNNTTEIQSWVQDLSPGEIYLIPIEGNTLSNFQNNNELLRSIALGEASIGSAPDVFFSTTNEQINYLKTGSSDGIPSNLIDSNGRFKTSVQPESHGSSHQVGGNDVFNVTGLAGVLSDQQHIIPSEAIAAMGPKGNNNPLNHDRFQQTEIVALPETQLQLNYVTHSNANDPTLAQKQALNASLDPSMSNPFLTKTGGDTLYSITTHGHATLPTVQQKEALDNSISPSSSNPFTTKSVYESHANNLLNPHNVTQSQVGLSNVNNTSDLDKPVSTATQIALNNKENLIATGTTSQYYRGDKSWQTLNKAVVGLENADNTSDLDKPISTATQVALSSKENSIVAGTSLQYYRGDKTWQTLNKVVVGLENVDNTSDVLKPISTATQAALNGKENSVSTGTTAQYYRGDKTWQTLNKAAVGLGNADNTSDINKPISTAVQTALNAKINSSLIGANNGVVPLGSTGKIPTTYLPDGYDNVNFYSTLSAFPATGTSDVIYIAEDTNLSYRWSGSGYVLIGNSLALGETSSTAYRGDRGKIAYDHSQLTSGNPHNVSKTDIGLSNVDNTADINKPISTATQAALNGKENSLSTGTTAQFLRGDKSWQTLELSAMSDFALSPPPNASGQFIIWDSASQKWHPTTGGWCFNTDASTTNGDLIQWSIIGSRFTTRSVSGVLSEAQLQQLGNVNVTGLVDGQILKWDLATQKWTPQTLDKTSVGLSNVDNTSDLSKPVSTATQTALNAKENSIVAGTSSQYWRGDKTWQTHDKTSVGLSNVTNDAQLKITSNLSDLNSASIARSNLGLGDAATRNVGTTVNDVAAGVHQHPVSDIVGVPINPNNGTENVLTELNNNLSWTPKSSGSGPRFFEWQVHQQSTATFNNGGYFRAFTTTSVCGSDSGWRGTNIYPVLIPFNMIIRGISLRFYNAGFDWRNSVGNLFLQIQLLDTLQSSAVEVGKLNFNIGGSFSGNSTGNNAHSFTTDSYVVSSGIATLTAGMLIGVKFRKDINQEGQISSMGYPHLTIIGEKV